MHSLETIKKLNGEYPPDPEPAEGVKVRPYDLTGAIIEFESGGLSEEGVIELFQHLVDTGVAWQLQGSYGRQAMRLIAAGLVSGATRHAVTLREREFNEARKEPLRKGRCAP